MFFGESFGAIFAAFHDEFVERRIDRQRIIPVKAGETEFVELATRGADHAVDVEITETIDT